MIQHLVLTKFQNPDTDAPEAVRLLKGLVGVVPGIVSLRVGRDFLGSDRSWDIGLAVVFENKADLAVYADHPAHVKVKEFIHAHRTASATADFEF